MELIENRADVVADFQDKSKCHEDPNLFLGHALAVADFIHLRITKHLYHLPDPAHLTPLIAARLRQNWQQRIAHLNQIDIVLRRLVLLLHTEVLADDLWQSLRGFDLFRAV